MKTTISLALAFLFTGHAWTSAQSPSFIQIEKIGERTWLVDPDGQPFFAHGVTHIGHGHEEDVTRIGQACRDLGFNAYGYGCPAELKTDLPYVEGRNLIPISQYRTSNGSFRYVDIFDPSEQERLKRQVERLCAGNRENTNLIGYFWTDLGAWNLDNASGTNWVEFMRNLPADSPGLKAYRAFLETWNGDDDNERDLAFLRIIAREYFRVLGETNRESDPNHLIFGDRFSFQSAIPEVIEEMLPYVDAIAIQPPFQPGFPQANFDRIHELTGKPILICDFAIRFNVEGMNVRGWRPEENARIAGQRYAEYVRDAMETSYILGIFWCNPIDSQPGFGQAGVKQGLFGRGLEPRRELNQAILELNRYRDANTPER